MLGVWSWSRVGMLNPFRLKAVTDFSWVIETVKRWNWYQRVFFHLNSLLRITTVIPNQQLCPATSAKSRRGSQYTQTQEETNRERRAMRELWDFLDVKATVWYHSCVCQQDRGYIGIWDSNNSLCHTHSITVTREEDFFFINNTMVIQIGTDEHSLQGRIVGFCGIVVITSKGVFYWFPKFLSNAKTRICICILFLSFYSVWPHFAVAFLLSLLDDGARLQAGI